MKRTLVTLFAILSFQVYSLADMVDVTSTESTYISSFGVNGSTLNFDGQPLRVDELNGTRSLIGFSNLFGGGSGQVPFGSTIDSAFMSVKTTSVANAPSNDNVGVHQVITPWDQTTVTWDSFNTGGVAGTDYFGTAADTFNPTTGNTVYDMIDITSIVQNWSNGAAVNGVMLISDGTDGLFLHDDSSVGMGPSVKVNYTAIPEPSSFFLLGLIGAFFGCCRRWKTRK